MASFLELFGLPNQLNQAGQQNFAQAMAPTDEQSLMAQMFQKQHEQQDPHVMMREINPGMTWGGRDKNAVRPQDLLRLYFSQAPSENP